jgi:hypothetical protein
MRVGGPVNGFGGGRRTKDEWWCSQRVVGQDHDHACCSPTNDGRPAWRACSAVSAKPDIYSIHSTVGIDSIPMQL